MSEDMKKYLLWAGLLLLGAYLAPKLRQIPVIGPKLPA
jgi:hypothetical protein